MKAATSEKKMPSAKAKHPTELIRQIQKGLRFLTETCKTAFTCRLNTRNETCDLQIHFAAAKAADDCRQ